MIFDQIIESPVLIPGTADETRRSVIGTIEAGESTIGDMPTPNEIHDLGLLLLAGAALLSPNKGDEGPIEDHAWGTRQDLEMVWL